MSGMESAIMEKLVLRCIEMAKNAWIEGTKSNGNSSEADKRAIGDLANTILNHYLSQGIPLEMQKQFYGNKDNI